MIDVWLKNCVVDHCIGKIFDGIAMQFSPIKVKVAMTIFFSGKMFNLRVGRDLGVTLKCGGDVISNIEYLVVGGKDGYSIECNPTDQIIHGRTYITFECQFNEVIAYARDLLRENRANNGDNIT